MSGHQKLTSSDIRKLGRSWNTEEKDEENNNFTQTRWKRLKFYVRFAWRFIALGRMEPLFYGIALTDRCNLSCQGCRVSNTGRPDMKWEDVISIMKIARDRGFRELYFSGGEPVLWRDGKYTIKDLIIAARKIGFFHIHVYTNGTLGIDIPADLIWVSIDGLPDTFNLRRGNYFNQVESAVRMSRNHKIAIIYVIDRNTKNGIKPFLQWVNETGFPIVGVMFYFHTPYYGYDELFLSSDERAPIIDNLLAYKRQGFPIINSKAGLEVLKSGKWTRRLPVTFVADVDGEYVCCRAPDETCVECGYAACTEITEFKRLRPSAVMGMRIYL